MDISWFTNLGLAGLFIVSFLAYTIIPLPVEAAIVLSAIAFDPLIVLVVAMVGSTLGTITTFYLGYKGVRSLVPKKKRDFKYNAKARQLFDNYGALSLLFFGWLPLIGDPLVILAGSFGMKFWKFLVYSFVGRLIYFMIVIWLGMGIEGLL